MAEFDESTTDIIKFFGGHTSTGVSLDTLGNVKATEQFYTSNAIAFGVTTDSQATSIANNSATVMGYNNEYFDESSNYNGTDTFTAPINGIYHFTARILWDSGVDWDAGDHPWIGFSRNAGTGTHGRRLFRTGNFTDFFTMQTSATIKLDATDTIKVHVYQATGTAQNTYTGGSENAYNWFSGCLIQALS